MCREEGNRHQLIPRRVLWSGESGVNTPTPLANVGSGKGHRLTQPIFPTNQCESCGQSIPIPSGLCSGERGDGHQHNTSSKQRGAGSQRGRISTDVRVGNREGKVNSLSYNDMTESWVLGAGCWVGAQRGHPAIYVGFWPKQRHPRSCSGREEGRGMG